jgi:hypothetical protein
MIKLSASVSKKVPIDGLDYSSRSYSAGLETEMPSGCSADELQCRLKQLYGLLEMAVDEQISHPRSIPERTSNTPSRSKGNGNGKPNGSIHERSATRAQMKAIRAIAREHGMTDAELDSIIRREFSAEDLAVLSVRQASAGAVCQSICSAAHSTRRHLPTNRRFVPAKFLLPGTLNGPASIP